MEKESCRDCQNIDLGRKEALGDLKAFLSGKHYFLVDGGNTVKTYASARAKLLDEMLYLKDPHFADVIGNYLLKQCGHSETECLILQNHKTLRRCVDYLMERAWELVDEESKNPLAKGKTGDVLGLLKEKIDSREIAEAGIYIVNGTAATNEMMKMAEADIPVIKKRYYGSAVENYKTGIYMRCRHEIQYKARGRAEKFYFGLYKNTCKRWIKGERTYQPFYMYRYYERNYEGAVYRRNLPYLARTKLSRTGLPEILRDADRIDPKIYLEALRKKPYLEQLVKAGLIRIANDIIDEKRELEIKEAHDFAKALGIDKNQMKRLREHKGGFLYLTWLKYEKQKRENCSDLL